MKNIFIANNEGFNCIRVMKNTSVEELNALCKELDEFLSNVSSIETCSNFYLSKDSIVLDIDLYHTEKIGTVEFISEEDINADYYELFPIKTSPQDSNELPNEVWETHLHTVIECVVSIIGK